MPEPDKSPAFTDTTAAKPAGGNPSPAAGKRASTSEIIERWFHESFNGSAVARDTQVWNVVHAAKEDLKRRLETEG